MMDLRIAPFRGTDDPAACRLDRACVQGGSLAVRFSRPSFAARSEVYDDALILCAWAGSELAGTVAGAQKRVRLNGEAITAAYFYDLRVHPSFRTRGCARALIRAILDRMGNGADCVYILVAGQNERMLSLVGNRYRYPYEVVLPLTYVCLPTYRPRRSSGHELAAAMDIWKEYVGLMQPTFVPECDADRYHGRVASIRVDGAGCSIWSNERIMAEEVVRIPPVLRMLRASAKVLGRIAPVPSVPADGSVVRSWYLYDLYARSEKALANLLGSANNLALEEGRTVVYTLLPERDDMIDWIRRYQRIRFSFPYRMLIRGRIVPGADARVYIDVRDL